MFKTRTRTDDRALMRIGVACVVLAPLIITSEESFAEWKQWGGPHRNFMVEVKGLADSWPENGPKRLWRRALGDGYSTIVFDNGILYTMYRKPKEPAYGGDAVKPGDDEYTIAIDARTGKTLWEQKTPSPFTKLMAQYGPGPHATPLIVGPYLYTIGTNDVMHCYDKRSGKVVWMHDLVAEFGAPIPGRGYGNSPIAYKNTIIVAVDRKREPEGQEDDAEEKKEETTAHDTAQEQTLMAFDQRSGSVIWKRQDYPVTYASPILIHFEGEEQLLCLLRKELIAVNPNNGDLLWRLPFEQEGANLSTPYFNGKDTIFCSSAYDSGSRGVRLTRKNGKTVPKQIWYTRKMRVHHGNVIGLGDYVYGSSGDFGPAFYMGLNIHTGKVVWRRRGFKKANCVYGDGKVIILDEEGNLALARVSPQGLTVLSKAKVAQKYAWAAPTLVGKTLYIRDRKHIMAFDLG